MSNLLSETFTNAFAKVRLSSDRVLKRFIRLINSIMNFAVRVLQLFLVTLLYFSAVKVSFICLCMNSERTPCIGWILTNVISNAMRLRHYIGRACVSPCEVTDHVLPSYTKSLEQANRTTPQWAIKLCRQDTTGGIQLYSQPKSIQLFGSLLSVLLKALS